MKWIRERREQLGITQDDLAAMLQVLGYSVGSAAVSHWETGKRQPPLDDASFVSHLADALKLDDSTVLRLSGFAIKHKHGEMAERAASLIDKMPSKDQQRILRIIESYIED